MTLSEEQRAQVVTYLEGPAMLREAADMLGVPWPTFADDYRLGMADAEARRDTEAGRWYLEVRAARSRTRAQLRAEAHATAGSRESADLLALLARLESEAEPLPSSADNPRASGSLWIVDALGSSDLSDAERERLQGIHEDFTRAGLAVLEVQLEHDAERRARREGVAA